MTHWELAGRAGASARQWFHERLEECVHCRECNGAVTPWDLRCPHCGQEHPAKVSTSAAVYLVIGASCLVFVLLLVTAAF
jgi:hypothetical protein